VARVWSIVVAGGSGRRFGEQKQFSSLGGRPVVSWSLDVCRAHSEGVVLVVPEGADPTDRFDADAIVTGSTTRAGSVRCGLEAVPDEADVIVVHDAARPLASPALFAAVLGALHDDDVVGAVPGLAPSDTIKVVDSSMNVTDTLERTSLVAVQTPQAFRAVVLRAAHARGETPSDEAAATDDAMLVEAAGGRVRVVPGDPGNIKITTPDDLATAERLLSAKQGA
jgi:2-C-methyl-D-erythritol 4-phosphate cytidylyltransferase